MSLRHLLEEFPNQPTGDVGARDTQQVAEEAARTQGYEAGYKSGWEDAVADDAKRRGRINAEFERCIQDLGLSYHEAVDLVRSELSSFLGQFVDAIFPAIATDVMRETVCAAAMELAEGHLNPSIKVLAAESVSENLQDMLPESALDIAVEVEPSLGEYQAYLTVSGQERAIDFQPLIAALREQLAAAGKRTMDEANHDRSE